MARTTNTPTAEEIAVSLEGTKDLVVPLAEKPQKDDDGYRTVLHGYGILPVSEKHWIDDIQFIGGVARNVTKEEAECLLKGILPESEKEKGRKKPLGRVKIFVLPSDATEGDFAKATGIRPMPAIKFATMLSAYNLDELIAAMGEDKALDLSTKIKAKIAGK